MRVLYFDCAMGAAGDMLTAALYELLDEDGKKRFVDTMNNAGIPDVEVIPVRSVKCGITGTHMKVLVGGREEEGILSDSSDVSKPTGSPDAGIGGREEGHDHHHGDHDHHHEGHDHEQHHHEHSSLHDIEQMISKLSVPDRVKRDAVEVYRLIAEAESHAHSVPVTDIHFHEVGTKDAVADVVAVCLLIDMTGADRILASNVNVGSGHVHCAHGILPVPAPATAFILRDVPIYQGHIRSELCTPTGAALLKYFVSDFTDMPVMKVSGTGYGMGRKDFEQANCVRVFAGETGREVNSVSELVFNVDDMTGEQTGYAVEQLFAAGALEAYTVPIYMKKSRAGIEFRVLCKEESKDKVIRAIFKYTTTNGIRENVCRRHTLDRYIENVETSYGIMRRKISEGYGVTRRKWEYDDLAKAADDAGLSIFEVTDSLRG